MLNPVIDLNCDMGEGMDTDSAIFPFISSANIACGAHAGNADTMRRTIELALKYGVAIGAHPSYPDRRNFGRIDILGGELTVRELEDSLYEQLSLLARLCKEFNVRMRHVKPHGAMYNRAAKDAAVSELICRVVAAYDEGLLLYGLSGSLMEPAAAATSLRFISEVFADRNYLPDGSLTPRTEPDALIEDPARAVAQVLKMIRESSVATRTGDVGIKAQTVCLHGDGAHAVEFAKLIRGALDAEGAKVGAPI